VLQPEIAITKATSDATPKPGEQFVYTVLVHNRSLTTTATATVSDPIPAPLTGATWICATTTADSSCGVSSGTGDITDVPITLAPGDFAAFRITVTVPGDYQGGTIVNMATATPTGPTLCADDLTAATCSDDVPITVTPDPAQLLITKSHTPTDPSPIAGSAITYTVTVTNTSPSTIAHATFDDPVPAGIDASGGTWTTATTGAGTTVDPASGSGFPTGETITMTIDPRGTVTFTINAHVASGFSGTNITNVATATPGENTSCEDGADTCVAEDTFVPAARLAIEKSHSPDNPDPAPGDQVTYTVTISNHGNDIGQGSFSDPLPAELDASTATWSCTPTGTGSVCGPPDSGTGSPSDVAVTVAAGGNVTFTIVATIRPSQVPVHIVNTGTVTPGTNTACEDTQPTCSADDEFTSTPPPATLLIHKAHSPANPVQGDHVTYTITVSNSSQTTRAEGIVNDVPLAPALTDISWTASPAGGATVAPASGTGSVSNVAVVIPVGGTVTFTVDATVDPNWPGGDVVNTASVTPGGNTECDPSQVPACSDNTQFPTPSLITIKKFHAPRKAPPKPGHRVIYVVVVRNLSYLQDAHATLDDPLPPSVDRAGATWTTQTFGAGTTATPASGTGPPAGVDLTIGPEGAVIFLIHTMVVTSFTGGTITNTATATPGDNTACEDGNPTCDASTSFDTDPVPAHLRIAKTYSPRGPFHPGDAVTYTVTVTNTSSTTTGHGTVSDPIPPGIVGGTWSAGATSGSSVSPSSGSMPIHGARVTVAPGGVVTFTIHARIDPHFNASYNIENVATIIIGTNTKCSPNTHPQGCNTSAVFHVITPSSPESESGGHQGSQGGVLPFTGFDALIGIRAALLLLLTGAGLIGLGRTRVRPVKARRRRQPPGR